MENVLIVATILLVILIAIVVHSVSLLRSMYTASKNKDTSYCTLGVMLLLLFYAVVAYEIAKVLVFYFIYYYYLNQFVNDANTIFGGY